MGKITFFVAGQPRGKGRPRHTKTGHVYTDQQTRNYETEIKWACKAQIRAGSVFEHAVKVFIVAVMKMPKNAKKAAKNAMLCGLVKPEVKPDLDNIVKAVLDGCNGVGFKDDRQVVEVHASKIYGAEPGVHVTIEEIVALQDEVRNV